MPSTGNSGELRSRELHVGSSSTGQAREGCKGTRHGTVNAYKNHGCRCPIAVRAWSRYMKSYRLRRLRGQSAYADATGTHRRLHALMAIGWTCDAIGARMGCSNQAVSQLTRRDTVLTATAAKVRAVYDDLADTPGPSRYTVTLARNESWLPPLWWDDDTIDDPAYQPFNLSRASSTATPQAVHIVDPVVVERIIDGQPPLHVTRAERAEAVRVLHARGKSNSQIGKQLGVSGARVRQILAATVRVPADTPATNDCQESA